MADRYTSGKNHILQPKQADVIQRVEQDYDWNALVNAHGQEAAADVGNTEVRPDAAYRHNQNIEGSLQQGDPSANLSIRANANQKTPFGKVKEVAARDGAISYVNGSLAQEQFTVLDKPHEISLDISWPQGDRPEDRVATPVGRMANDDFKISGQPSGGTQYDGGHLVGAVIYNRISNLDANIAPQERSLNEKFYNNVFEEVIRQNQTDAKKINMNVRVEYSRQNYRVTIGDLQTRGVITIDDEVIPQPDLNQEVEFVTRVPTTWYARAVFEGGVLPGGTFHNYKVGADAPHGLGDAMTRYGIDTPPMGTENAHTGDSATGYRMVAEDLPDNAGKTVHFVASQKAPNYAASSAKQEIVDYYAANQQPYDAERATAASGKNIAAIRQDRINKLKAYYGNDLKPANVPYLAAHYLEMRNIRDSFNTLITQFETTQTAVPLSGSTNLKTDVSFGKVLDRLKRRKGIIDRLIDPAYANWLTTINTDFENVLTNLNYLILAVDIHDKRGENLAYGTNAQAYLTEVNQIRAAHDAAYRAALAQANEADNAAVALNGLDRLRRAKQRMTDVYFANYPLAGSRQSMWNTVSSWVNLIYIQYEAPSFIMKSTRSQQGNPQPVMIPESYQTLQNGVRNQMNGHWFTLPAAILNQGNTYDTIKVL